jgi:hypothetical protein
LNWNVDSHDYAKLSRQIYREVMAMSQAETEIRGKNLQPTPESEPPNGSNASGFVLKPIDVPAALALLQSFYEEDEQEQHETWELLERALAEHRP